MYLNPKIKQDIYKAYSPQKTEKDAGSPESQIALWTFRIKHLTNHLKDNRKDKSTQRGLQLLVGKRRRMLNYLRNKDINRYRAIIKELGLRG